MPLEDMVGSVVVVSVAAISIAELGRRVNLPYPIALVIGGALLGFVNGFPDLEVPPNAVLFIFLPPLLYWAAFNAPLSELSRGAGRIAGTSLGLVALSMCGVAVTVHTILHGTSWAVAFVTGAILAPTDDVAFSPIAERFSIPRHVIAWIQGESLFNDASSLVFYAVAVTAVLTGSFALAPAFAMLAVSIAGAVGIGLLVGDLVRRLWRLIPEDRLSAALFVLAPFVAFLFAQRLHISTVLAVVTTGMYVSRWTPTLLSPRARAQALGFWSTLTYSLNVFLFFFVGSQVRPIFGRLVGVSPLALIGSALAVTFVLGALRAIWLLAQGLISVARGEWPLRNPHWAHFALSSWSGIRGGVSLAAALGLPAVAGNMPFPQRETILALSLAVVLLTLVGQGLTLPWMIRLLKIEPDDVFENELRRALAAAATAALARLDELGSISGAGPAAIAELRRRHNSGRLRYEQKDVLSESSFRSTENARTLERELVRAQRQAVVAMRFSGSIDAAVMAEVTHILDLYDLYLEALDSADRVIHFPGAALTSIGPLRQYSQARESIH